MLNRKRRMLLLAFLLPLIAIGLPYWQAPYNSAAMQLPNAFFGWPLVLVFFAAVASRLSGAGFLAAWGDAGATMPIIVLVKVLIDTNTDPTTHNAWPLEMAIAAVLGFGIALLGTLAGHFAIKLRQKPETSV
jgi:hypothetical protein